MLHTETVEPGTFSLLKELMDLPGLEAFLLVGGTALALRYGHRSSVNLNLFFHEKIDHPNIIGSLEEKFKHRFVYKQQNTQFGIFCFIGTVKVDIINLPHQPIAAFAKEDKIRMYSSADIAAMKT